MATNQALRLPCRLSLILLLATSAPGLALAGTWTDDFEDDVLTPPWTEIEGNNSESSGQLHASGMSGSTHVGPAVHTVVPELSGESHVHFSGTVTSNDGGSGFTLKADAVTGDRCGIYIWANGGVWSTHDDDTETYLGQALIGPSANAPALLEAELDGTTVSLFLYGAPVWSGTVEECNFTGDGTVGIEVHVGRTAHWDDFNASWYESDGDGDGYCPGNFCEDPAVLPGDCDDADAANSPGGTEVCDGQDNDCDGLVDDADLDTSAQPSWWTDTDLDGYGDPATAVLICIQPSGTVSNGDDCNDGDGAINPGQAEACNAIDDDCSGNPAADEVDGDGDGMMICAGDCDDGNPLTYTGASEICDGIDNDCNSSLPADEADDDGDGVMVCQGDCDDGNPAVHPGANEACDGLDNDCDGAPLLTEADSDSDGFMVCAGDCNDSNDTVHPGALEVCDGLDNDCDGTLPSDEGDQDSIGGLDCHDGDGDGYTELDGDCNDTLVTVAPGLAEVCDLLDNNCDGQVDEGLDSDGDGIADCFDAEVCDGLDNNGDGVVDEGFDVDGDGITTCEFDCDDREPAAFPGNPEICDSIDNDCDEVTDNAPDSDGDTFGPCDGDCDDDEPLTYPGADEACDSPADNNCDGIPGNVDDFDGDGVAGCDGDCDDDDEDIHPTAEELCDSIDNNCDGDIDEGFDGDLDGHSSCGGDCDDAVATTFPGAEELCNGVDDDCDELVPEDETDGDEDGFRICEFDCDDEEPSAFPGAEETCDDAIDRDCDGIPGDQGDDCGPGPDGEEEDDHSVNPGELPECGCSTVQGSQPAGLQGWLLGLLTLLLPMAVSRRRR